MMISDHASEQQIRRFARGLATPEERNEMVRHLLHGCASCGRQLAAALGLLRPAGAADYAPAFARGRRRLSMRRRQAGEERAAAVACWELLDRWPPAEREAAVRRDPALWTPAFWERLVAAGRASRGAEAEAILRLALTVAGHLAPALGARICEDLRAEAWGEIAGARRRGGDLEGPAAAMTDAWKH